MARATRQLRLDLAPPRRWGGKRPNAGRKPKGERAGMPHLARPVFAATHPAHVTLRVRPDVPSLRTVKLVHEIQRSFAHACDRNDFRLIHYSLQGNHAHLLIEASNRTALARGMKSVCARLARAVNRVLRRTGAVLADRYHMRILKTPREVRNALRYVLLNARRHARRLVGTVTLDPASSAGWFDGWSHDCATARKDDGEGIARPVGRARTWLLTKGWRIHGLIDPADVPGP